MTGISIGAIAKSFGDKTVLDGIDVEVEDGEFVCLLGPSGCGKSTLLRSLAGLESPDGGIISLGGDVVFDADRRINVAPERRQIGMVFQSFALWPHRTVYDNVAYPLRRARTPRAELAARVEEALRMVDLWELRDAYPGTLSGGQQQRVALARAVVGRPRLLLLDEPLSSLDTNLRAQMRREIRQIQQQLGATAVYVTHDKEDAGGLADRVIVLQDGRIVQEGAPSRVFASPRTAFVAEFVGFDNFFDGIVADAAEGVVEVGGGNRIAVTSEVALTEGAQVSVAVRSRLVSIAPDTGVGLGFRGRITSVAHLGDDVEIVVDDGGARMVARVHPDEADGFAAGQSVVARPHHGAAVAVEGTRRGGTQAIRTVRATARA